jgi:hypothetical protein
MLPPSEFPPPKDAHHDMIDCPRKKEVTTHGGGPLDWYNATRLGPESAD